MNPAIYVANTTATAVTAGGTINLGSIVRKYGCALNLSGSGITASSAGYYDVTASVTVEPTAAGDVTVSLYKDGAAVPGATATGVAAAASDPVNLAINAIIRKGCSCGDPASLTLVCSAAGSVANVAMTVNKL